MTDMEKGTAARGAAASNFLDGNILEELGGVLHLGHEKVIVTLNRSRSGH